MLLEDTSKVDLSPYGNTGVKTPTLQMLADKGLKFENTFITAPSCSPSHASFASGQYPNSHNAAWIGQQMPKEVPIFPEVLKDQGYHTVIAGKWDAGATQKSKFDQLFQAQDQENWVLAINQRPKHKPLFLWASAIGPHRPFNFPDVERLHTAKDARPSPWVFDNEATRLEYARYYDQIAYADKQLAKIMTLLAQEGELANTIILATSDHGRPFLRSKATLYDSGTNVPLIVYWPKQITRSATSDALLSSIDIAPTLFDILGLETPESFYGKSFLPVIKNPEKSHREFVFIQNNRHGIPTHERAIRTAEFLFIKNNFPASIPHCFQQKAGGIERTESITAFKNNLLKENQLFCYKERPAYELYDVKNDPYQLINLSGNPTYSETLGRLKQKLEDTKKAVGDPVWDKKNPQATEQYTGFGSTPEMRKQFLRNQGETIPDF